MMSGEIPELFAETRLVGRASELRQLTCLYRFAAQGKGSVCLVRGEAGAGKSALTEAFKQRNLTGNGFFLTARCRSRASAQPYGAFSDLLDAYLSFFSLQASSLQKHEQQRLSELMGPFSDAVIRLNRSMSRLFGHDKALPALEADREQRRFQQALSRLFLRLAPEGTPYVLLIEDIHWMDESGVLLLEQIADEIGSSSLLLLLTLREGEPFGQRLTAFLQKVQQGIHPSLNLMLRPFDPSTMELFVADQLGISVARAEPIAWRLQQASMGNPCYASSLLRTMVEEKALVWTQGSWREDSQRMRHLSTPANLVDLLVYRIRQLLPHEIALLGAAAVIGREFSLTELARLAAVPPELITGELEQAIRRNLIGLAKFDGPRINRDKELFAFTHERVREAALARISDQEQRRLHERMVGLLAVQHPEKSDRLLFRIANHAVEANAPEPLRRYALPAAERAREMYANVEALRLCEAVSSCLSPVQPCQADWLRLKALLADLYQLTGRYEAVVTLADEMLPLLQSVDEQANMLHRKGMALFRAGRFSASESALRKGLLLLGERMPATGAGVLLLALREWVAVLGRPRFRQGARKVNVRGILNLYQPLGWKYVLDDVLRFMYMALRTLHLGMRHLGPSAETGRCLSAYGSLLMAIPFFASARRIHEKAIAMRMGAGDLWGEAQGRQLMGYSLTWGGQNEESFSCFRQALEIYERIGDEWEQGVCWNGLTNGYLRQCLYQEAKEAAQRYLDISERTGDAYGLCTSLANLCLVSHQQGLLEQAEAYGTRALLLARENHLNLANCFSAIHLGCALIHACRFSEAVDLLEEARELAEHQPLLKEFSCHVHTHLAEAMLGEAMKNASVQALQQGPSQVPRASSQALFPKGVLLRLRRLTKKALRQTRAWPNRRGDAERVHAMVLAQEGRYAAAVRYLQQSIAHNLQTGRRYPLAQAHREMAATIRLLEARTADRRSVVAGASAEAPDSKWRHHLQEAARLFRRIDARMDAEWCDAELAKEVELPVAP